MQQTIAVYGALPYTASHVIDLSGMPDRCVDLLSVSRIRVFWHREASNLEL
jgi:hypothetical protein